MLMLSLVTFLVPSKSYAILDIWKQRMQLEKFYCMSGKEVIPFS